MPVFDGPLANSPISVSAKRILPHDRLFSPRNIEMILKFKDGDLIELDHHIPRSLGGRNDMANLMALHLHCHDQRHANNVRGINENDHRSEEPDEGKAFTSGSEDE